MTNERLSIDAACARETAPGSLRTGLRKLISACAAIALGVLAPQCVSLARAVELAPTDKVSASLLQPAPAPSARNRNPRELHQRLLNETEARANGLSQEDQLTKVVSTESMQLLLDAFATGGFFEHAGSRELISGHTLLEVRINDRGYVWARAVPQWAAEPGITEAELKRRANQFTLCQAAFLDLYNATRAYRTGTGIDTVMREHEAQIQGRGGRQ